MLRRACAKKLFTCAHCTFCREYHDQPDSEDEVDLYQHTLYPVKHKHCIIHIPVGQYIHLVVLHMYTDTLIGKITPPTTLTHTEGTEECCLYL